MTLRSTLVALAATLCTLPAWAGGFVNLPSTGTDIRVDGANNPAADPMFLADNPFASGYTLLGYPAVKMETHVEIQKALRRLPRLAARVAALEKGEAGAGGEE